MPEASFKKGLNSRFLLPRRVFFWNPSLKKKKNQVCIRKTRDTRDTRDTRNTRDTKDTREKKTVVKMLFLKGIGISSQHLSCMPLIFLYPLQGCEGIRAACAAIIFCCAREEIQHDTGIRSNETLFLCKKKSFSLLVSLCFLFDLNIFFKAHFFCFSKKKDTQKALFIKKRS